MGGHHDGGHDPPSAKRPTSGGWGRDVTEWALAERPLQRVMKHTFYAGVLGVQQTVRCTLR